EEKEKSLEEIEAMGKTLKGIVPESLSTNKRLPVSGVFATRTEALQKALDSIPETKLVDTRISTVEEGKPIVERLHPRPIFDPDNILSSPDAFMKYLDNLSQYIEESRSPDNIEVLARFMETSLRDIGRPFLTKDPKAISLLQSLESRHEDAEKILLQLTQLSETLHLTAKERPYGACGGYGIAAYSALCVGWYLATGIDRARGLTGNKSIESYGMDTTHFKKFLHVGQTDRIALKNRQLEEDYQNILSFLDEISEGKEESGLFNLEKQRQKVKSGRWVEFPPLFKRRPP
ncbi:MAG: hypothetical protein ACE5GN_06915, partial [Waddliaceae bacterium]